MLRVDWTSRVEEPLYRELIKEQILFNLTLVTGRQLRNVSVTKFSGEERKVFVSGEVFSLSDIVSLDFTGKESVRFFQKILQKLPQSVVLED